MGMNRGRSRMGNMGRKYMIMDVKSKAVGIKALKFCGSRDRS